MEFDIKKFVEEFKKTVDLMLRGKHTKQIMSDLQIFKNCKDILEKDSDSPDALRVLIKLIKSKGWRLNLPGNFDDEIDGFLKKHGRKLRTSAAKTDLIKLVGSDKTANIEQLIKFPSIEKFTKHLYYLATQGQTLVLGEKGRDNYLRDFGHWDRIPIDRIEMRFIIRTGIYHACSTGEERDPLEKSSLHDTLARFSSTYLKGKMVGDIDLGNAPGIVDTFIWSYSAEERYQICVKNPKCEECNLNKACLYSIFRTP